jgi:hypothetical protein
LRGEKAMKSVLKWSLVIVINVIVFAALLGGLEVYYRIWHPRATTEFPDQTSCSRKFCLTS